MDKKSEHKEKSIELRSEKVRNIVGQIPSLLIRQGILIIGMVLLIVLSISAFVPYRKTLPVDISVYTVPQIEKVTAPTAGIFMIDTILKQAKPNQIVGNLVVNDMLLPIKATALGKVIWNVQNNDFIKKKDLLFIIVPPKTQKVYGGCSVHLSQKTALKKGQKVFLTDYLGHQYNGKVTTIYPIPAAKEQLKVRISIDNFPATETVNQLKGRIILEETTFLRYFMKSLKI